MRFSLSILSVQYFLFNKIARVTEIPQQQVTCIHISCNRGRFPATIFFREETKLFCSLITFVFELFLPEGETVWKTNPLVVAEAFGVLDVREERRERVVLLCLRNDPLKD